MICTLAQDGKTVGVTANSHKVIRNVLDQILKAAPEFGASVECLQKVSDAEPNVPRLQFTTDNAAFLADIGKSCQVGEQPLGCGRARMRSNRSTRCSSTRRRRCHSQTC